MGLDQPSSRAQTRYFTSLEVKSALAKQSWNIGEGVRKIWKTHSRSLP